MADDEPAVWEIRLGIFATEAEAGEVKQRIIHALCPNPDHAPPCPIPWEISGYGRVDTSELDTYETLLEQVRIERGSS
ncbi:hypothetical protein [Nocardia callitridis]|uniref:SPOR domain-containing protein n=1 Tax=Nocardia callitridis TaxID=648753 RepID=A0ABP9L0U1_9NOCA